MNTGERINLCKVCKNRKFSMKKGIVCGLTDEKPSFGVSCDAYIEDSDEIARNKRIEEECEHEDMGILESVTDANEKLRCSNWFSIVGYLSLLNIGLAFIDFEFIFSLGSTQIAMLFTMDGIINSLLGIFTMLALPGLLLWTGYLASKKGDRLAYLVGTLLFLFDTGLVFWLWAKADYMPALIVNIIAHSLLSVMFIVCLIDMFMKKRENEQKMTRSRLFYIVVSTIVLLINIPLLLKESGIVATSEQKIEQLCESAKDILPKELANGVVWIDVDVEGNTVVMRYQYQQDFSDTYISKELRHVMEISQKEIVMSNTIQLGTDPLLDEVVNNGTYSIRMDYWDYVGNYVYSVTLMPNEIKSLCTNDTHRTSNETWNALLDACRSMMPYQLDEYTNVVDLALSENRNAVEYTIEFNSIPLHALNSLSNSDYREFSEMFEGDYVHSIAHINGKQIVFHFTCAESPSWHKKIEL